MMKFRFKNIMVRGIKHHELVEMSGVRSVKELPLEYVEEGLRIYSYCGDIILHQPDSRYCKLEIGMQFSAERTGEILRDIATTGKRLAGINKKIKEEARNWEGKVWEVKI